MTLGRQRNVSIRPERPSDRLAIRQVTELAFGRSDEADLVDCLRDSEAWVPGLSLVAEAPSEGVVGHLLLSRVRLTGGAWTDPILSLAPLSVLPHVQRQGIGSALLQSSLTLADRRLEPVIVVLGDPDYYARFGFERAAPLGIEPAGAVPDEAWMLRRLSAWSTECRGTVAYPSCFDALT